MFDTVLVANRGEIAVRVMRTLRELGIRSVAVHSDADADALHVAEADVAVRIGPAPAAESYLSADRVLEAARRTGAQAIHPGYGFLSENAAFARACTDAGVVFIGPPPEAMEAMGDKISAKQTVEKAGVPVVPGVHRPGMTDAELLDAAGDIGYPLMVKAAAGGGGKGMRVVEDRGDLADAVAAARREGLAAFGDDDLLLERFVPRPRHIEIQVFADTHGGVVSLGERECSLQRRHQKVIEECPSPLLDETTRERMGTAAVEAARACGYVGAGTVEFIVSGDQERTGDALAFFFLEMNTRLQVEHPVTEEVYGVDLVEWQLRVAAGEPLPMTQDELEPDGWAVEARVYAEDPARGFLPTGGEILLLEEADLVSDAIRVDSGVSERETVSNHYDPMLAKVIAHAPDRDTAIRRLHDALADHVVLGVTTNLEFLRALLADDDVRAGNLDTGLIDRKLDELVDESVPAEVLVFAALARMHELEPDPWSETVDPFAVPDGWRVGDHAWAGWQIGPPGAPALHVGVRGRAADAEVRVGDGPVRRASLEEDMCERFTLRVDGQRLDFSYSEADGVVWIAREGRTWRLRERDDLDAARSGDAAGGGTLLAPMPGTVTVVNAAVGDAVTAGQALMVVEAMKMEHPVTAPFDGIVAAVHVTAGQSVAMDAALAVVEAPEAQA